MSAGLFKNVQMQDAQKTEPRGVYGYTLSGAVCSATQQMSVFQQSLSTLFDKSYWCRTDGGDLAIRGNP